MRETELAILIDGIEEVITGFKELKNQNSSSQILELKQGIEEIKQIIISNSKSESNQVTLNNASLKELRELKEKLINFEKIPSKIRVVTQGTIPLFGKKSTSFIVGVLLLCTLVQGSIIWFNYDDFKVLEYSKTVSFEKRSNSQKTVYEALKMNARKAEIQSEE